MKILTAESAGFCFGVNRAVQMAADLADSGEKLCTLGPIIHNEYVVNSLKARGVFPVDSLDDVPEGYSVVIRSHGVGRDVYDELSRRKMVFHDATCPFVSKIHRIVSEQSAQGLPVFICGDAKHPEVIGICRHVSGEVHVVSGLSELEEQLHLLQYSTDAVFCLAAQTTFNTKEWNSCTFFLKKYYTKAKIFDTICNATAIRQKEAVDLSKKCDIIVIIGGKHSSNTKKLEEICRPYTRTLLIENASELDFSAFRGVSVIGVTAGASTPADIIKEVQKMMNENLLAEGSSFEEMLDQSFKSIYNGEKVNALVVSVQPNEVIVDVGTKHTGYVSLSELTDDPNAKIEDLVKVGDHLDLVVLRVNDVEGTVTLSKKRLEAEAGYEEIAEAAGTDKVFEGVVVDVVKGGVLALAKGVKVFIPASLATLSRVEDLSTLLKQPIRFKVLEVNRAKRRALGSAKAVLIAEKKEKEAAFWENVEVGKIYTGTVKSLTSYGAFVDLGGVDGMIHISELSWKRIKKPSDVVKVGDVVEVYVKDIDRENKKISLGYKKNEDNPWEILKSKYAVGDVCKAKIISMTTFGAFAEVIPGIDGLIHISQISNERIAKPQDVLKVGQEVDVKITELDFDKKRVSLSMKALLEDAPAEDAAPSEMTEAE